MAWWLKLIYIMKWINYIKFVFMPHYWLMNDSYNKQVDDYVNCLFEIHPIKRHEFSDAYIRLGGVEIWVENQPYACLMPTEFNHKYRPSRQTIYKRLKQVNRFLKECREKDIKDFVEKNPCVKKTKPAN